MSLWMSHCEDCGSEGATHRVRDELGNEYVVCGPCSRLDAGAQS